MPPLGARPADHREHRQGADQARQDLEIRGVRSPDVPLVQHRLARVEWERLTMADPLPGAARRGDRGYQNVFVSLACGFRSQVAFPLHWFS